MASQPIRQPAVAGLFYPADPHALLGQVQTMLAQETPPDVLRAPKALIVPHAGYMYSGSTAAAGFGLLESVRESIRRVVLVGPSHRVAFKGIALPSAWAFATPLGTVDVDDKAMFSLSNLPEVVVNDHAHAQEHSLEVLLPFLQVALDRFSIVPLVVGQCEPETLAQVLNAIWGGPETLIIISSDLSHYHSYTEAQRIDQFTTTEILAMQARIDHEQACGATGINALLLAAQTHGCIPRLLALRNSGDTAGDRSRVVGYAALDFSPSPHPMAH